MSRVTSDFHPRAVPAEQVHIYVDSVLVERCALQDRQARMAAHGHVAPRETSRQAYRREQRERGGNNGVGFTRSGRRS